MRAWRAYIIGTELMRQQLHRELQDTHGLSINDYEVLVQLSERPDRQMRMTELAGRTASSKSRLSHQIARLEKSGLVRRLNCPHDARGVIAQLTDLGLHTLSTAAPTHVDGVRRHLIDLLTPTEQTTLTTIFERVLQNLTPPVD